MKGTTNKTILILLLVCMAGLLSAGRLFAVNPVRIDTTRAHLVIPRPALESLPTPLVKSPSDPIDTLDTVNEYIKVIRYGDNTRQYYKTPEYQKITGVFDEHWSACIMVNVACGPSCPVALPFHRRHPAPWQVRASPWPSPPGCGPPAQDRRSYICCIYRKGEDVEIFRRVRKSGGDKA